MKKHSLIPNFMGFYNLLWQAALPFLKKNNRLAGTFDRRISARHLGPHDIWIQAASAGEALLAVSLLQALTPPAPVRILVTTTTAQGMEILAAAGQRLRHPHIRLTLDWFPFDLPKVMKTAAAQVTPKVMVLLETELWPAHLYHLKHAGARILVANARMSRRSGSRYRATRCLWRQAPPHEILAVSTTDARRYQRVFPGARVSVMPNIKFQGLDLLADVPGLPCLADAGSRPLPVSILASLRRREEKQAVRIIQRLHKEFPGQVIAVFPRHMHRVGALKRKLAKTGLPVFLRSHLTTPLPGPGIILWDRFGELRSACRHAQVVFVGGSLVPLGGQNFLEPVLQGTPTVTGPFWDDFFWVGQEIFDRGLVHKQENWQEVTDHMIRCLKTPEPPGHNTRALLRQKARDYVRTRAGGAELAARAILRNIIDG